MFIVTTCCKLRIVSYRHLESCSVNLSDLDYELPPELIAQKPLAERDKCRMLVLNRATGKIAHSLFHKLPEYLTPTDLMVLNDARVIQARLYGVREATGGAAEVLLVEAESGGQWRLMSSARGKLQPVEKLQLEGGQIIATLIRRDDEGLWRARLDPSPDEAMLRRIGTVPLPRMAMYTRPASTVTSAGS